MSTPTVWWIFYGMLIVQCGATVWSVLTVLRLQREQATALVALRAAVALFDLNQATARLLTLSTTRQAE